MDEANPRCEAVVYENDKVIFAGSEAEALKYESNNTEIINMEGAVVLPGLMDAHAHLLGYGKYLNEIRIEGSDPPQTIRQKVLDKIETAEPGEWISGRGWDQTKWEVEQFPTYLNLEGTESNPVFLKRVDGHAVWVNKAALDYCELTRDTPDPEGGEIIRFPNGEPTGVLIDMAVDLVADSIPQLPDDQKKKLLQDAMQYCNSVGLTGIGDAWINDKAIDLYKSMIDDGLVSLRIYGMLDGRPDFMEHYEVESPIIGYGDNMLTVRTVKMFADGALGSRGALFFEPYSDRNDTHGLLVTPEEELYLTTLNALKNGFQCAVHAIGDSAINVVLNSYERALKESGEEDAHLRIEHCQIISPGDIPRLKELGVIASMQPTHATSDMYWAEERVGADRIRGGYAWRFILNNGINLAFGSDFPVEHPNPFYGIYAAVTRKDLKGYPENGWYPEQCLTVEEAVRAFTVGSAYAQFQEDKLGRIKSGMLADFTIIDRNIFEISPEEIPDTEVLMTIVGGEVVFNKEGKFDN